jgi:predicted nucleotidyltransferase
MPKITLRTVLIDFIFQDTSLMDHVFLGLPIYSKTEIIIRCFFFFLLSLILWSILRSMSLLQIIALFLICHFINWFFNGHGYQIFYKIIGIRYSAQRAVDYILRLKEEGERKNLSIMIYGSWSRGEASEESDLDIFIISVESNFLKSLEMGFVSLKYRLLALFALLSVDIYVIDEIDYLRWRSEAKPKEKPIILNDPTSVIKDIYRREKKLEEFLRDISRLYKA